MTPQLLTKGARGERRLQLTEPARIPSTDRPVYPPDEGLWAERRAAIGQRPMAFRRHRQSAGTVCVRLQLTKPARIPSGAEPGHEQSGGLFVPGEGLGQQAQRGLQGRPVYPPDEGLQ